jgi:hypothetical protein
MCQSLAEGGRRCPRHTTWLATSPFGLRIAKELTDKYTELGVEEGHVSAMLEAALLEFRDDRAGVNVNKLLTRARTRVEGELETISITNRNDDSGSDGNAARKGYKHGETPTAAPAVGVLATWGDSSEVDEGHWVMGGAPRRGDGFYEEYYDFDSEEQSYEAALDAYELTIYGP